MNTNLNLSMLSDYNYNEPSLGAGTVLFKF